MDYLVFCPMCLGFVASFVQLFPCSVVFVCVVVFEGKYQVNNPFKTREYRCLSTCGICISWRPVQVEKSCMIQKKQPAQGASIHPKKAAVFCDLLRPSG